MKHASIPLNDTRTSNITILKTLLETLLQSKDEPHDSSCEQLIKDVETFKKARATKK